MADDKENTQAKNSTHNQSEMGVTKDGVQLKLPASLMAVVIIGLFVLAFTFIFYPPARHILHCVIDTDSPSCTNTTEKITPSNDQLDADSIQKSDSATTQDAPIENTGDKDIDAFERGKFDHPECDASRLKPKEYDLCLKNTQ